jgi:hypothetical protein
MRRYWKSLQERVLECRESLLGQDGEIDRIIEDAEGKPSSAC